MLNQSYYPTHLCGPRGAEQLSFAGWKARGYDAYKHANPDLFQSYAFEIETRSKQLGKASSGDGEFASLTAASWFERDQTLSDDEQGARFTYLMCREWRNSEAGLLNYEAPARYNEFAEGSIARITSKWAFDMCVEEKFEVYGEFSRSVHRLILEAAMCLESQVQCKKDEELCLGTCAGKATTQLPYDFNSMVAISELNPDVIGQEVFESTRADCNTRQTTIDVELFEGGVLLCTPYPP